MERCNFFRCLTSWRCSVTSPNRTSFYLRNIYISKRYMRVHNRRGRQKFEKMLVTKSEPKIIQETGKAAEDNINSVNIEDEPVIKFSKLLTDQRLIMDNTSLAAKLAIQADQVKSTDNSMDFSLEELEREIQSLKSELKNLKLEPENTDPDYKLKQMLLGKSDSSVEPSSVPCGGCGANLHCANPLIPGFMPASDFKEATTEELETMKCTRCTLMSENQFLKLDIDEKAYQTVIDRVMADKQALVIMLIDVTDISNTLIEGYVNDMVKSKPVIIVGNKIDLIPPDAGGHKHLNRLHARILNECYKAKLDPEAGDIQDVFLISAKTGFGVEDMISKLIRNWRTNGNIYLVGTTNSGKSTLFNKFLESDYCKSSCRDVVQRATISRWPGTTFDLLKFPLARLSYDRFYLRMKRIKNDRLVEKEMMEKRKIAFKNNGGSKNVVLCGSVGKTDFRSEKQKQEDETKYMLSGQKYSEYTLKASGELDSEDQQIELQSSVDLSMFSPTKRIIRTEEYPDSQWVFDTPGLINSQQLLTDLTADELQIILDMQMIRPRVYVIQPGDTMFITGMGRIDYLKGKPETLATVHLQHRLPVRVVKTEVADDFYEQHLNSDSWDFMFKMPILAPGRLEKLSSMEGKTFTFSLDEPKYATVDVQLSSLGWVSFAGRTREAEIKVYTPGGKGIHLRTPALLPNILTFKGVRIRDTQAYALRKVIPRPSQKYRSRTDRQKISHDEKESEVNCIVNENDM